MVYLLCHLTETKATVQLDNNIMQSSHGFRFFKRYITIWFCMVLDFDRLAIKYQCIRLRIFDFGHRYLDRQYLK